MIMDKKFYENSVRNYTDAEIIEQYNSVSYECNLCWDNANDCTGEEKMYWYDELKEAQDQLKILKEEKVRRGL